MSIKCRTSNSHSRPHIGNIANPHFFQAEKTRIRLDEMREGWRALLIPGLVFLVLGTFLFFVTERITVKVEFMSFSFMLILMLVAGVILFGSGLLSFLVDRLNQ